MLGVQLLYVDLWNLLIIGLLLIIDTESGCGDDFKTPAKVTLGEMKEEVGRSLTEFKILKRLASTYSVPLGTIGAKRTDLLGNL
jgi:hypothetical protein